MKKKIRNWALGILYLFIIVVGLRIYISATIYHIAQNGVIFGWLILNTIASFVALVKN